MPKTSFEKTNPKDTIEFPKGDIINDYPIKKPEFNSKLRIKEKYVRERYKRICKMLPIHVDLGELRHRGYYSKPPQITIHSIKPDFKTVNASIRFFYEEVDPDNGKTKKSFLGDFNRDEIDFEDVVKEARKHYTKEQEHFLRKKCEYLNNPNVWESCFFDTVRMSLIEWPGTMEQLIPSYYRDPDSDLKDVPDFMIKDDNAEQQEEPHDHKVEEKVNQ